MKPYETNPVWRRLFWGMVLTAAAYLLWSMKNAIVEAFGAVAAIWPGNVYQTVAFFVVMAGLIVWDVSEAK